MFSFIPAHARPLADGLVAVLLGLSVYIAGRYLEVPSPIPSIAAWVSGVSLYCALWAAHAD
jgi:hypothetical protein